MQLSLYNSLTKKVEPFQPLENKSVRIYSCGPTVYNYAHIGNMRAFMFADLLQRIMRTVGKYDVKWVMNITNIDDKTIRDSAKGSAAWNPAMGDQTDSPLENLLKLTKFYEAEFINDISNLGIDPNHFFAMPKATEYIKEMQELIRDIVAKGFGYVSGGSVYFDVTTYRKSETYGKLFKIDFDNFRPGTRVDSDQYEREQASDFVLWKSKKEGEPFWEFEIGGEDCSGRPGWHIECSAMEKVLLGLPFDVHTGGVDLKFPHHEDEIAQSKAGYGIEPTAFWCHNEFLEVEGEKMSKSAGNFFTLRDLMEKKLDPIDIRFAMFSAHYSSKYNFTLAGVTAARKARLKIQEYIWDLIDAEVSQPLVDVISALASDLRDSVFNELGADLHTPKALGALFGFINGNPVSKLSDVDNRYVLEFFKDLDGVFAAWNFEKRPEVSLDIPQEVADMAEQRFQAKKNKDWAKADELRKAVEEKGFTIKDSKEGYEIIPA